MFKSLLPIQHQRPPHCALGSSSIELSLVLGEGTHSGDGVNFYVHYLFHILTQSDSCLMRRWKKSSFITLQNGVLFGLFIVASSVGHHRHRKYSQMLSHFWPLYIKLWDFLQNPQRSHFLTLGPSGALCLKCPGHVEIVINIINWAAVFIFVLFFYSLYYTLLFYICYFNRWFRNITNTLPF